jgi:hypothetical protein
MWEELIPSGCLPLCPRRQTGRDCAARADIVDWKDALLASGMSNVTVRDVYLVAACATLQYALDQGKLVENPAAGVKVRAPKAALERDKAATARRPSCPPPK